MEPLPLPDKNPPLSKAEWWRSRSAAAWLILLIAALAAAVRIAAAGNDLWLDEIWSCFLARSLSSPAGVFTQLHHDNNHYLNTLYLYFIGDPDSWIIYRLPSIIEGVGSVVLAAVIARQRGKIAAVLAALLIGGSFLMIHYSSEARGYAGAVFFGLLGVYLADRFTTTRRRPWACAFAISAVLGFLSHLTYLQAYLGLLAWTTYRILRAPGSWRQKLADLAWCHALPIIGLAVLYWIDIRHMQLGGGPVHSLFDIATSTLSLALGGPVSGPASIAVAVVAITLAAAAVAVMYRSASDTWVLFTTAIFVSPVLMIVAFGPVYLFERYFLVSIAFLLLSLPWLLTAVPRQSAPAVAAASLGVLLFLIANSVHTYRLVELGRGSYLPTLKWIASHSRNTNITIGSDHDFRNGMLIEFYRHHMPPAPPLIYLSGPRWPAAGPEWIITHTQRPDFTPPPAVTTRSGIPYVLVRVTRYSALSGWDWFLYHRRDDETTP